ncbi:MAG TPA: hypothetical protein DCO89_02405 [Clostridiales bacterium]|nr:hypothetical protein [Clostridiales bacterium]
MLCPKCYGRIKKDQNRCYHCGFNINQMQGASNKQAKKALKGIYKDDVLYTTEIPEDVSKKKLLLLTIFLGLFGANHFYVGKFWQGLYMCISSSLALVLAVVITALNLSSQTVIDKIFQFILIFQGVNLVLWLMSIVNVAFGRYKIPVYKDEFSKK